MEERIIEDEGRSIKVKRNALGGIEDATDGTAPSGDAAEERADAADDVEIDVPKSARMRRTMWRSTWTSPKRSTTSRWWA